MERINNDEENKHIMELSVMAEGSGDCYRWGFQNSTYIAIGQNGTYRIEKNGCCKPRAKECTTMNAQILCEVKQEAVTECLINLMDYNETSKLEKTFFAAKNNQSQVSTTSDTITITDDHETKIIKTNGSIICEKKCILRSDTFKISMSSQIGTPKAEHRLVTLRWEAGLSLELKTTHKLYELLNKLYELLDKLRNEPLSWCGILGILASSITTFVLEHFELI